VLLLVWKFIEHTFRAAEFLIAAEPHHFDINEALPKRRAVLL